MNPEIVIGPPGTGKTTRLLDIVDEEFAGGLAPGQLGYLSFTKRAAKEATERATEKFKIDEKKIPFFRTLHSLCFRQLGLNSADVLEGKRLREFSDWIGIKITGYWSADDGAFVGTEMGDRILFMENLARVRGMPLRQLFDEGDDQLPWNEVDRVARGLAEYKQRKGLVDYTDMLDIFARSSIKVPLDVLLVDESQDLSHLQWNVVRKLADSCRRIVVAGDDDQAIYRWAGADVDQFVDMAGQVTVLGQSWRVPRTVQAMAGEIISGVKHRRPKDWKPRDTDGVIDRVPVVEEMDLDGKDVIILARNRYVLREQIEPLLRRSGVIYESFGHSSVSRSTLEAITAWEDLRAGKRVTVEQAKTVYEKMSSGLGVKRGFKTLPGWEEDKQVDIDTLRDRGGLLRNDIWHDALDRLDTSEMAYLLAARRRGEKLNKKPRVRVSTIHGSKGGQADHVILATEMAKRTSTEARLSPEDEARVWYVGVTRARERLTIVSPQSNHYYLL